MKMTKEIKSDELILRVQKGDIIQSNKGIHFKSEDSEYLEFELIYLGNGKWRGLGNRKIL